MSPKHVPGSKETQLREMREARYEAQRTGKKLPRPKPPAVPGATDEPTPKPVKRARKKKTT